MGLELQLGHIKLTIEWLTLWSETLFDSVRNVLVSENCCKYSYYAKSLSEQTVSLVSGSICKMCELTKLIFVALCSCL